jgi:Zn-dependent protease
MANAYAWVNSIPKAIFAGAFVSALLAVTNLLPIFPMDGGQMMIACGNKWLPQRFVRGYKTLSTLVWGLVLFESLYDSILASGRLIWRVFRV